MRHSPPFRRSLALVGCLTTLATACAPDAPVATTAPTAPDAAQLDRDDAHRGVHRQYGVPQALGEGKVRTYVVTGRGGEHGPPIEVGIAIDARALEGTLPAEGKQYVLRMPENAPDPYEFALFDWNPQGHEPPGVYDLPHFDFHFYFVPWREVARILPTDPNFAARANDVPTGAAVPPFYVLLMPPGATPADIAVPQMGVHWLDIRAPEIQRIVGNPGGWAPFTKTFIYGSWAGRFTFVEPMITRDYLLERHEETIPVPTPAAFPERGWYPSSYSISYDATHREYHVALTNLTRQRGPGGREDR